MWPTLIPDEQAGGIVGRGLYDVVAKQSVKSARMTDRNEVGPTQRKVGMVLVAREGGIC